MAHRCKTLISLKMSTQIHYIFILLFFSLLTSWVKMLLTVTLFYIVSISNLHKPLNHGSENVRAAVCLTDTSQKKGVRNSGMCEEKKKLVHIKNPDAIWRINPILNSSYAAKKTFYYFSPGCHYSYRHMVMTHEESWFWPCTKCPLRQSLLRTYTNKT